MRRFWQALAMAALILASGPALAQTTALDRYVTLEEPR